MTDRTPQTQQPSASDGPRHPDRIALNVTLPLTLVEDVAVWQPGLSTLAESIVCQLADVILEAAGRADLSGMAPTPLGPEECTDINCWDHLRRHCHDPRNPARTSPWSRTGTSVDYIDPEPPAWVG